MPIFRNLVLLGLDKKSSFCRLLILLSKLKKFGILRTFRLQFGHIPPIDARTNHLLIFEKCLNSGRVCIQLECSIGGDMTTLYVLWVSRSVTPSPLLENLCSCVIKQLPISKLPLASLLRYDLCTAIHLEMSFICL